MSQQQLIEAMSTIKEQEALAIAQDMVKQGADPFSILEACKQAMAIVGDNFAKGVYFLPELVMAGQILMQISELIKPLLKDASSSKQSLGRVVVGTVEGDIHDIGKDIVVLMLEVNGFEVRDLGIDVPAAKFVEAVKEFNPQVVALSGFLTVAFDNMKKTVEALKEAGLRDKVKIQIGGGQIDEEIRRYTGADDYGLDAMEAVSYAKKVVAGGAQ
ncbi:MAG: cobalamin-dependent protein [Desulfarculus sp.]|nr:cobalamin-dependent protein [Desulfarculus sp.]